MRFFVDEGAVMMLASTIVPVFNRCPSEAWYREGADVQTCLGHVNLSGTQAYLPMPPELLDEASKRFARYACVDEQENDDA